METEALFKYLYEVVQSFKHLSKTIVIEKGTVHLPGFSLGVSFGKAKSTKKFSDVVDHIRGLTIQIDSDKLFQFDKKLRELKKKSGKKESCLVGHEERPDKSEIEFFNTIHSRETNVPMGSLLLKASKQKVRSARQKTEKSPEPGEWIAIPEEIKEFLRLSRSYPVAVYLGRKSVWLESRPERKKILIHQKYLYDLGKKTDIMISSNGMFIIFKFEDDSFSVVQSFKTIQ